VSRLRHPRRFTARPTARRAARATFRVRWRTPDDLSHALTAYRRALRAHQRLARLPAPDRSHPWLCNPQGTDLRQLLPPSPLLRFLLCLLARRPRRDLIAAMPIAVGPATCGVGPDSPIGGYPSQGTFPNQYNPFGV
jgi:hypothetical protein